MLLQHGNARSLKADRRLACSLAGVAGALNTAGFYAVGLYSANMSGNVSGLADHLGVGDLATAGVYVALVGIFISGATTSTLLMNAGRRRGVAEIYAVSILVEAVLLIALGCADLLLPRVTRGLVLVLGLSFLMGLQNAVVTRISNARIRTTHVTGMITDIGIELGNLLDFGFRGGTGKRRNVNAENLRLHAQTVASFLGGGIIGVIAFRAFGVLHLFGAAAFLLALALHGILTGRNHASSTNPEEGASTASISGSDRHFDGKDLRGS
jgi:uncharacterized membrane protein YoaK (UPF0700 family)